MNNELDFYIDIEYDKDINDFDCGFEVFNAYLKYKFLEDKAVIHYIIDAENDNLIAYFSLLASSIFLNDTTKQNSLYASNIIPAIEIKMFAIDKKYRGLKLSGLFLEDIYNVVIGHLLQYIGAEALILYSVPSDKVIRMYEKSGFKKMPLDYSMYTSNFNNRCIPMYKLIEF